MTDGPVGSNDSLSASGTPTPQATNADLDAIQRAEKLLAELKSWRSINFSEEEAVDILPALIALARDGLPWRSLATVTGTIQAEPIVIELDAPAAAEDGE